MSSASDIWFDFAVETLNDPQNQRVWSVIVSVFGDLAQSKGDQLSGGTLSRIIMPLGIKSDAIRVALHRLRKDGWIDNTRIGRQSAHFLTPHGRALSVEVTPRIYQALPEIKAPRFIVIADDAEGTATLNELIDRPDYFSVARTVALGHGQLPENIDTLMVFDVTARSVPVWFRNKLCPPDLVTTCRQLLSDLRAVMDAKPADLQLTPQQIATLRTLIVHRWRRVVLRHPDLPEDFFPADWVGAECRQQVAQLLDVLPCPKIRHLEAALSH